MLLYVSIIIALLALIFNGILLWKINRLDQRFKSALGGSNVGSLENTLSGHLAKVLEVDANLSKLTSEYEKLSTASSLASQKISIVRFNPFGDTGGDQSFSLAILDAYNSGYVLTSIHGRQGTRIYVKPIDYGTSKYTLSDEEKQAVSQAIKRVPRV